MRVILPFHKALDHAGWHVRSGAVIVAFLGACALLPRLMQRLPLTYLLGASGAVGLALVAFQDMALGLTLLVFTAGIVPFSIGTGTQSPINLAMLIIALLIAIWLLRMILSRQVRLVRSGLNAPLMGFLVAAALSWIVGDLLVGPNVALPGNILIVQAGQYGIYVLLAAAFFLSANHEAGEGTLKVWTGFLILVGVSIVAYQVSIIGWKRDLAYWNGLLYMWPFVLLFAQILFNPDLDRGLRLLGWGALLLWAAWAVQITMGWKGGWVPAVLAMGMLLLLKSWRLFVVAVLILSVLVVAIGPDPMAGILLENEDYSANPVRWNLWADVFRMGARSPLFGLGLANYEYAWQDPSFESASYAYMNPYAFSRTAYTPPAHNMFADIFAQTGALGLFFLLWALVAGVRLGLRVRRLPLSGFARAHVNGVLCGFAAAAVGSFVFADWLIPYVYDVGLNGFPQAAYSWLLLGTLVPLAAQATAKENTP